MPDALKADKKFERFKSSRLRITCSISTKKWWGGPDTPLPHISTGPVRRARDTHHLKRKSYKEIAQNVVYLSTYILYYVSGSRPVSLSVFLISITQFTNYPKNLL